MSDFAIYACGGAGTNIGKQIHDLDIDVFFIDTSDSNIRNNKVTNLFLLEGVDGAGKDRSKTYQHFKDVAEDILIRFKPSQTLNVVISSLGGGSGAVIAPMITKELISKNLNTIVIGIDSQTSIKELDNTIKTLKTYKSISDMTKKCVSLFHITNNSRKEADKQALYFINLLSVITNKYITEEFDTSDIHSFINFNKVTDNSPTVSIIEINPNENILPEKNTSIVSTVLVTKNKDATISAAIPDYLTNCVVTDKDYNLEDMRIDNVVGKLSVICEDLEKKMVELTNNKKLNKHKEVEIDDSTPEGIVL